jgi:hypothetical protein
MLLLVFSFLCVSSCRLECDVVTEFLLFVESTLYAYCHVDICICVALVSAYKMVLNGTHSLMELSPS